MGSGSMRLCKVTGRGIDGRWKKGKVGFVGFLDSTEGVEIDSFVLWE